MRQPRFLNRWYANLLGYFWIACSRCGQMFGGHETGGTDWILEFDDIPSAGKVCCYRCPDDETLIAGNWRRGHWLSIQNELAELRRLA